MKYSLHFFAHLDKWFFSLYVQASGCFLSYSVLRLCVFSNYSLIYMYLLFFLVFTLLIIINKPAKVWDFVSFKLPYGVYLAVFKIITHAYDTNAYSRTYVTKRKRKKRKEFKFLIFQKHNGNCEIRRFHTENFLISKHFRFVTFSIVCYIVSQNFFNFFYLLFILISPIRNS